MGLESLYCSLHHLRVAGEPQVVVGAEVEDGGLSALHLYCLTLPGGDHSLRLPGTGLWVKYVCSVYLVYIVIYYISIFNTVYLCRICIKMPQFVSLLELLERGERGWLLAWSSHSLYQL